MGEERTVEEIPFPPYVVRFIEGRDERLLSELRRVETQVQHNAGRIDDLRQELERRFIEAREDRQAIRQELERRFTDLRQELERRFTEAREDRRAIRDDIRDIRGEIGRLDSKIDSHFQWVMGIMIPIALGILAIIVRVFFFGFGPTP